MRVANYSRVERTRLARARGRARALEDSNARGREFLLDTFEWLRDWGGGGGGVCTIARVTQSRRATQLRGVSRAPLALKQLCLL